MEHGPAHHLKGVEDGDGAGGELHPPVLLISHVGHGGTLLTQDTELGQRQSWIETKQGQLMENRCA